MDIMTSLIARASDVGPYNYIPTTWICIMFLSLFGVSTLLHVGQAGWYRLWWMYPTACLCGAAEVLGWGARLYSSYYPASMNPFDIQITATITAPTPLIAANFVTLEYIIKILGPRYSRLSPRLYTIIFCTCDLISLTIQGAGGGMAAIAVNNGDDPTDGSNVMLAGIIIQMTAITLFVILATEFLLRFNFDKPVRRSPDEFDPSASKGMDRNMKIALYSMAFNTTCLFVRAVYRTVELTDGWNGPIISNELYFNVLDASMIILAIYTVNLFHPGRLVMPSWERVRSETASLLTKA